MIIIMTLKEKINASIILGSYLDTLGFYNGLWEFNFKSNMKIDNLQLGSYINYEILSDFFSKGGFNIDISDWNSSDDTIMMIATIKACNKGGDQKDFIDEYLKIMPLLEEKKRLSGVATINSLRLLKKYRDPSKILYSSSMGGNGAAMRTHYIGIHFKDIKKIIDVSIMASRLTHNYPLGFLSGMAVALFTHWAINDIEPWKWCDKLIELEEKGTIDEIIKKNADDIYDKYMIDKTEFWNVVYKYREFRVNRFHLRTYEFRFGFDRNNDLSNILYNNNLKDYSRMGGDGVSAVLMAYDSILLSIIPKGSEELTEEMDLNKPEKLLYSWQNLVFLSTLHFGDNDTIGAIAGMLFGALRGFDGVSNKVLNMLEFKDEIKKII
jgi:ADP-ribosylarginine hydrolase